MSQTLIQFKVTGDVQGVNFRHYTQKEAQKLGLKGHVYNHDDSSVQGVAIGAEEKIKQFQYFLSKGPSSADVHNVELIKNQQNASEEDIKNALGDSSGFEVRR
ncbi:uncharacterized protein I303_103808 [Kwoniella dejecticola CBS 10117]|uniref:acylphosphatase n=1 Tax=Kwoniella dejecticola CBS 10117 TaxID=1296121 RepID=A0A1A6A7S3_9TREE|nr:uncharacterized protein I303_03827 [Kwoniella dejecticola CBS 10117]OBR86108.1 hypothetical protein I303_03827 [Kwoniella dejecticola CBS 10117]